MKLLAVPPQLGCLVLSLVRVYINFHLATFVLEASREKREEEST